MTAAVNRIRADVVVIGAGPAGSTFATRMVQLGFDVCLVERSRFPRPRLGESLSPGVMPLLASVGSAKAIDAAGFPRVRTVSVTWDGAEVMRDDPREQGLLVDRGVFDGALLAHAKDVGVQVLQPAVVQAQVETADGWHLSVDTDEGPIEIEATFLADASGRAARRGAVRRTMAPRTIAIHGYWVGGPLPRQPRIEAGDREWFWGVPIPDGSYNTLVFVDGERFRAEPGESLDDRLRALLGHSALHEDVRGARLRAPARAADATPYLDEECVSERRIRIGDAALALDPLSSSGVQKAIQSALSGAIVTNTLLRRPDSSGAALQFYRDSLREAAERHHEWAMSHYATAATTRHDPFWTERAGDGVTATANPATVEALPDDVPIQLSHESRWEDVPCLGSQFVEVRTALRHPGLEGPVAYVGGLELAPLLHDIQPGMSSRTLAESWVGKVPLGTGLSIARWLSSHGVLSTLARDL